MQNRLESSALDLPWALSVFSCPSFHACEALFSFLASLYGFVLGSLSVLLSRTHFVTQKRRVLVFVSDPQLRG